MLPVVTKMTEVVSLKTCKFYTLLPIFDRLFFML